MPRGRKREFDRASVLMLAADTFWENGYQGTGLADLLGVMGIARQSLYSTYGDKHSLFLEVLEDYFRRHYQPLLEKLRQEGQCLRGIETFLRSIVNISQRKKRGCMITNSITELTPTDKEVTKLVRGYVRMVNKELNAAVGEAQRAGQIRDDMDTENICMLLTGILQGTLVSSKVTNHKSNLDNMISATVAAIRPIAASAR